MLYKFSFQWQIQIYLIYNITCQIMQVLEPDTKNLWGCMLAGDIAMKNIPKKGYLIIGDSRIGKSTLFNYLRGIRMRTDKKDDGDLILKLVKDNGVKIDNCYQSVTLIPNIVTLSVPKENGNGNQTISLVDTAGFGDEGRNYVGVFGVSYMLERLFSILREGFKILLCFDSAILNLKQINSKLEPFTNFFEILKCQFLLNPANEQVANNFFDSISLVICKTTNTQQQIYLKLTNIIEHLSKKGNCQTNIRKATKKLLQSLISGRRIQLFYEGKLGEILPDCTILQNLRKTNWNFIKLGNNQQNLIKLPFEQNFNQLSNDKRTGYESDSKNKKQFIISAFNLLIKFIKKGKLNWYQEQINYDQESLQLQNLIRNHPYGEFSQMIDYLNKTQQNFDKPEEIKLTIPEECQNPVSRILLIQNYNFIHQFSKIIGKDNASESVFYQLQKIFQPCFHIFNVCRKTFSRTRQQEQKFLQFMFLSLRSIYECQIQSKIDKEKCAQVPFSIRKVASSLLPSDIWNLNAQFLKDFKPNQDQNQGFIRLTDQTLKHVDNISDPQLAKRLIYSQVNFYIKKATMNIKRCQFREALQPDLFNAHQNFESYTQLLPAFQQIQDAHEIQTIEFKYKQIYKMMAVCLDKINEKKLAIEIYKHIGAVYLIIQLYENWINQTTKKSLRFPIMIQYKNTLKSYGKKQNLIQLYERMIDQFECYPKKVTQLKAQLSAELNSPQNQQLNLYVKMLKSKHRPCLAEIVARIKDCLTYNIPDIEKQDSEDQETCFQKKGEMDIKDH